MSPKRAQGRRRGSRAGKDAPRGGGDVGAWIAAMALAAAMAGACWLVDTRAEAAFDAPKRLVALLGIVVAVAALLVLPRTARDAGWSWRIGTTEQRSRWR